MKLGSGLGRAVVGPSLQGLPGPEAEAHAQGLKRLAPGRPRSSDPTCLSFFICKTQVEGPGWQPHSAQGTRALCSRLSPSKGGCQTPEPWRSQPPRAHGPTWGQACVLQRPQKSLCPVGGGTGATWVPGSAASDATPSRSGNPMAQRGVCPQKQNEFTFQAHALSRSWGSWAWPGGPHWHPAQGSGSLGAPGPLKWLTAAP